MLGSGLDAGDAGVEPADKTFVPCNVYGGGEVGGTDNIDEPWWGRPPGGAVLLVSLWQGVLASERLRRNIPGEERGSVKARSGGSVWCSSIRKALGVLGSRVSKGRGGGSWD